MNKRTDLEQYLRENGTLTYTFRGRSMRPLLKQDRDLYTLVSKTPERCRKGDVVLYRKSETQYVLHRIVEVREDDYVLQGDNCITKEEGIRDGDIVGVMTSFCRRGREISVKAPGYRLYVRALNFFRPLLLACKRARRKLTRKTEVHS